VMAASRLDEATRVSQSEQSPRLGLLSRLVPYWNEPLFLFWGGFGLLYSQQARSSLEHLTRGGFSGFEA
jgi:hypothetical protein